MDIKEEILAQMDSALRPEFDKAIDNTIEVAFKEDVKTLGFMAANFIKCQWEAMKPHLFYAYCLGVKAQEAKAQAVPEGFKLVPVTPSDEFIDKLAGVICDEFDTTIRGSAHCATEVYKLMIESQEPAND